MTAGSTVIDMAGRVYGKWTVLERGGVDAGGNVLWRCHCACGTERIVSGVALRAGQTKSCRCSRRRDLTGQRFGRLRVVAFSHHAGTQRKPFWRCVCDCGAETTVNGQPLRNGLIRSCGCLKRDLSVQRATKHGGHGTRTYRSWKAMRERCHNPSGTHYHHYGGRGITVCEQWKDFSAFLADMGECPAGLTIDRIDGNGNYEPGNCRWATATQQSRNTNRNHYVTINGVTRCLSEWAEIHGIGVRTVWSRIRYGWDEVRAITTPLLRTRNQNQPPPQAGTSPARDAEP